MRVAFPIAVLVVLLLTQMPCDAAIVTNTTISRTYVGTAHTTAPDSSSNIQSLNESESGFGTLGEIAVSTFAGGGTAFAVGVTALATEGSVSPSSSLLTFESASRAVHNTSSAILNNPSFGRATATVNFEGQIVPDTQSRGLVFDFTHSEVGSGNSGSVELSSNVRGNLFTSDLDALPSSLFVQQAIAETVMINVSVVSESFRNRGTFINVPVVDADSQRLTISVAAVPEPGLGLAGLLGTSILTLRRRRRI